MKQKILLAVLTLTFISTASAQFVGVEEVSLDIDEETSVEEGAQFTIEASGTGLSEVRLYYDDSSNGFFQLHDTYECSGSSCTVSNGNFDYGEEGTVDVQAEAYASDINKESGITPVTFSEEEDDRETSVTITGVPDEAEVGENYDNIDVEAYDSTGNLWNRDLDIYYRYQKGQQESERIGGSDCYWNPGLGTDRERCSATASFEPVEDASDHRIFARIKTSDGLIMFNSKSFEVTGGTEPESDLQINDVSIRDEELEEGESTTFEAEIENEGDLDGLADINWYADDIRVGYKFVNIDAGETTTVTLERDYSELQGSGLDVGETYDISAEEEESGDERDSSQTLTLVEADKPEDPADFDVEIDSADSVTEGETLDVEYTVTNEGDETGSQYIELNARGESRSEDYVSGLEAGESESGTLEWDTEEGDSGIRTISISSEDDEDSTVVDIKQEDQEPDDPAFFDVRDISFDSPVYVDDRVEVDYTVKNTGDSSARKTVRLKLRGETRDTESIRLDDGEEKDRTLDFRPDEDDAGFRQVSVSTNDDERTGSIDIRERDQEDDPAFFDVEIDGYDDEVTEGETVKVDYTVTNTGDQDDIQNIELRARGETQETDFDVDLDDGESESGTLEWDTEEGDSGWRSIKVRSEDDEDDGIVEVLDDEEEPDDPEEDSDFRITDLDSNSPVDEGDTAEVEFTVSNRGGSGSQYVEMYVRGERQDREWLSLDSDESETGTLRWQTEEGDAGYRRADVETDNDEDSILINVIEADEPVEEADVEFTSVSASRYTVRPGESTELRSSVESEGGTSASVQVEWRAGGTRIGSDSRTVPGDSERDLERDRSYSQLLSEGLKAGECYNLGARLRSGGNLVDYRDAPQNLCLEERDEPEDPEGEYDLKTIVLSSSGSPIEGAEVSAGSRTALTGSNGIATIEDLDEGTYDVIASASGYSTEVRDNVDVDRDSTISLTLDEVDGVEADFSFSPSRPLEDQEVIFNGGLSSGDIESYEWDFDDGSTASGRTVEHEFDDSGFYRVNLEVEDAQGRTDDRTRVVQVRSEEADPEFYDLDVEVVDSETNDEIEDARVSVDGRTRTTDNDGETSFNLEESVYPVFVSADDYRSESRTVTLNRDRDIEVELDPRDRDFGGGEIRIQDLRIPASVCRGDDVTARLDIENTGERDRVFTLSASGLSNEIDRTYSLDEGDEFTQTVEFINVEGSGNERVSFTTGDDSRERTVQVRDCEDEESSDISITASPTQIRAGESVRVSGYVDNVERGTQVTIGSSNRYRSLGSATTDPSGRYELYVEPTEIGDQTLTAEASGMEASTRIEVLPTVSVISASTRPERVFEGDTYEVCARVESQSSGPLVVLKENGQEVDSKYGRGEVCFDRRKAPGNYNYEVVGYARGQSSTKTASVEVMEMDSEVRNFPDQIASVRSGSGMVRVQLYNNQREFRNYEISLEGLPDSWTSQSRKQVHLDSGEGRTEYLYFTPKDEGDFTGTLRVESEGRTVYTEDIDISSGGTDREPSRIDQFLMWLR